MQFWSHYDVFYLDVEDFLTKLAIKMGKLIKGGDPNLNNVAVQVINDWQRGKLPYFVPPPRVLYEDSEEEEGDEEEKGDNNSEGEEEDLLLKIQQAEKEDNERDGAVDESLAGIVVPAPVNVEVENDFDECDGGDDVQEAATKKRKYDNEEVQHLSHTFNVMGQPSEPIVINQCLVYTVDSCSVLALRASVKID